MQLPDVTITQIEAYLELFDQQLGNKVKDMYNQQFLRSIRYSNDDDTFIVGRVCAEMRKTLIYRADVKLDKHGVVQEAQCECAAGMGPEAHCKHVMVVLFALTHSKNGITTMETCTQQLQTFHQVKKYTGSPVKMQDLNLRRDGALQHLKDFDPRPQSLRKRQEYPHHFRKTWLNSRAPDIPIRHLYPPANIYAINNDHDYLLLSPEDCFLKEISVTHIDQGTADRIEKNTRGQSKNKLWHQERTKRIHSSNFGRICTATKRTDFDKLAESLTSVNNFYSGATSHGKKYESIAIQDYVTKTGNSVEQVGIFVSPTEPYLACSPDGIIKNESDGLIEVKCPFTAKDREISPITVPYLYENNKKLTLQESHPYHYQIQGALFCTGKKWCDLIVWTKKDMKIVKVAVDDTFVSDMRMKLSDFFKDHFRKAVLSKYFYMNTEKYAFTYE